MVKVLGTVEITQKIEMKSCFVTCGQTLNFKFFSLHADRGCCSTTKNGKFCKIHSKNIDFKNFKKRIIFKTPITFYEVFHFAFVENRCGQGANNLSQRRKRVKRVVGGKNTEQNFEKKSHSFLN